MYTYVNFNIFIIGKHIQGVVQGMNIDPELVINIHTELQLKAIGNYNNYFITT